MGFTGSGARCWGVIDEGSCSFEENWNKTARNLDFNEKEQVQSCLGWRAVLEVFKIQGFGRVGGGKLWSCICAYGFHHVPERKNANFSRGPKEILLREL